ncbi:MAG: plasmid stabilization protein [Flavobacteriaceae bacterium]|nr:MAG: plasmid stabilization protein [Flavobacteriaceae bacterium]
MVRCCLNNGRFFEFVKRIMDLKLSQKEFNDLIIIFPYGRKKIESKQSYTYLKSINEHFKIIIENPNIGRSRNETKTGLYSFPHRSHILFYRISKESIRIVSVLYGSRDYVIFSKKK